MLAICEHSSESGARTVVLSGWHGETPAAAAAATPGSLGFSPRWVLFKKGRSAKR